VNVPTDVDRWVFAEARKLAEVPAEGKCAYTGLVPVTAAFARRLPSLSPGPGCPPDQLRAS
jgi:hypothetical protein